MATKSYVWFNGQFVAASEPIFGPSNRSYAYGDGLFETIHAYGTTARHLSLHYKRLIASMRMLELDIPNSFTEPFLANEITKLLNKLRIFGSARVRITVNRKTGGYYTPNGFGIDVLIEAKELDENFFSLKPKGLSVDVYMQNRKPTNALSNIKSTSSLIYVLAGIHAQKNGVDECILINDQNRLAESTSSNIFLTKEKSIFTPPLSEGCLNGVMRQVVIDLAPQLGYKVYCDKPIDPEMLLVADEVFLTNAISGIKWVLAFKHIRYFNKISRELCTELNRVTFPDQFREGLSG